jgi:hypothetical protein
LHLQSWQRVFEWLLLRVKKCLVHRRSPSPSRRRAEDLRVNTGSSRIDNPP